MEAKYDNLAKLLFTDTDSLVYEIETNVFMKIFIGIINVLILVLIQRVQNFLILSICWIKVKDVFFDC